MTPRNLAASALALSLTLALSFTGCGPKPATGVQRGPSDGSGDQGGDQSGPTTPVGDAAIIAASKLPSTLPEALAIDPLSVEIHRLSNGLTVYISSDKTKPEFDAWIAVRSGSRNDPASSTGLAHYLEHMLFKGTSKLASIDFAREKVHLDETARLYDALRDAKSDEERQTILGKIDAETQKAAAYAVPNEFDQLYAGMGISGVNAFTSDDQTVYIARVPANRFEAWAKVEGDRFTDPQYRLFYPELEAVYEEKNRSLDSPNSRLFEALFGAMYPNHPYGTQPTIGITEHLKTPAYGDMVEYYKRWYVPNNMAIILAGDVDAATALPILEREFAGLKPRPLSDGPEARPAGDLSVVQGRVERTVVAPGQNSVYLAWRAPVPTNPRAEVFEVLDLLMDNSTTGLLNTELVLSQKLPAAGSFVSSSKEASAYVVWGTARAGQSHADVEALLRETLDGLKKGEFTDEDLAAVVVNLEINEKRKLESNGARVREMADSFINGQSWPAAVAKLARLRAVKRKDVIEMANTLGDNVIVVKRVAGKFDPPKINKPKITAVPIDTSKESAFAAKVKAMPARPLEPEFLVKGRDYAELELPAGKLVTAHNEVNDLFSVIYEWETGYRRDNLLCVALDALENSGTEKTDPVTLRKKLYAIGTDISFQCRGDSVTIQVSGIDRNLEASVAVLREWLGNGKIDPQTVEKLVANRISERTDLIEEPRFVAGALEAFATEGNASVYLAQPKNRDLTRLAKRQTSGKDLAARVAKLLASRHRTGYVGPRQPKTGADIAGAIGLGAKHKALKPRPTYRYRAVSRPTIYFVNKTAAQAQVRVLWPKKPLAVDKRPVSALYREYVGGGLGALIGQEIREARGLAYSAWGGHSAGERPRDAAALYAGLGTQADKTSGALAAVIELLRGLDTIDDKRFDVARSSIIESYRSTRPDRRDTVQRVFGWHDLGLTADPRDDYYKAFNAMSADDLAGFSKGLAAGPYIVAITGDKTRIDMEALAKLGRVITVKPEQLVSW